MREQDRARANGWTKAVRLAGWGWEPLCSHLLSFIWWLWRKQNFHIFLLLLLIKLLFIVSQCQMRLDVSMRRLCDWWINMMWGLEQALFCHTWRTASQESNFTQYIIIDCMSFGVIQWRLILIKSSRLGANTNTKTKVNDDVWMSSLCLLPTPWKKKPHTCSNVVRRNAYIQWSINVTLLHFQLKSQRKCLSIWFRFDFWWICGFVGNADIKVFYDTVIAINIERT